MLPVHLSLHLKYALVVLTGLTVIILLSKWTGRRGGNYTPPPAAAARIQEVVQQAANANTASHSTHQDMVDSLVDVTSAIASLKTAVELAGDKDVRAASGVTTLTLEREMVVHQRNLMQQLKLMSTPSAPQVLQPLPKI
jgi:hypothetical protein